MKKKVLAALLCVAMSAGMLAGCGNNSGSSNSGTSGDDKQQEDNADRKSVV